MNDSVSADSDGDVDTDFAADIIYPFAPPQQWVVLHAEVSPDELAVYTFTMAHLNPHTGKFDAHFSRKRIAERFGKSLDWVDKRLKGLCEKEVMAKKATYWIDAYDHSQGRSVNPTDSRGVKRAQAPNRYRVRMQPPGGPAWNGPIKIAEFYQPHRIEQRRNAAAHPPAAP